LGSGQPVARERAGALATNEPNLSIRNDKYRNSFWFIELDARHYSVSNIIFQCGLESPTYVFCVFTDQRLIVGVMIRKHVTLQGT
jgi:hypothetical protein